MRFGEEAVVDLENLDENLAQLEAQLKQFDWMYMHGDRNAYSRGKGQAGKIERLLLRTGDKGRELFDQHYQCFKEGG